MLPIHFIFLSIIAIGLAKLREAHTLFWLEKGQIFTESILFIISVGGTVNKMMYKASYI